MNEEYRVQRISYLEQLLERYETTFKMAQDEATEKIYYELCLECINEIKLLK
jgi:hypothetical protein